MPGPAVFEVARKTGDWLGLLVWPLWSRWLSHRMRPCMVCVSRNFQHFWRPLTRRRPGWPHPSPLLGPSRAGGTSAVRMQLCTILAQTRTNAVLEGAEFTFIAAGLPPSWMLSGRWSGWRALLVLCKLFLRSWSSRSSYVHRPSPATSSLFRWCCCFLQPFPMPGVLSA